MRKNNIDPNNRPGAKPGTTHAQRSDAKSTASIRVMMTNEEREAINRAAKAAGKSISEFVRNCINNALDIND